MKNSRRNTAKPAKRAYDVTIEGYGLVRVRATSEASARIKAASKSGFTTADVKDVRCVG